MTSERHHGPLTVAQAKVVAVRDGHTLDAPYQSFLEMPAGLPRPRWQGTPVPYTTDLDRVGRPRWEQNDPLRRALCVLDRRCGLCGDPLGPTSIVLAHHDLVDKPYLVVDHVALHDGCLSITMAWCPGLQGHAADLLYATVPTAELEVGGADDKPGYVMPPEANWVPIDERTRP